MERNAPRWFWALVMLSAPVSFAAPGLKEVKKIRLCGKALSAEVARSDEERSQGLMNRRGIAPTRAMVFVFESERPLSFWMKNVPFDIDIGFFDAKGNYVSHTTMAGTSPMQLESTLPSYPSDAPAMYAVEVSSGFFGKIKNLKACRLTPKL